MKEGEKGKNKCRNVRGCCINTEKQWDDNLDTSSKNGDGEKFLNTLVILAGLDMRLNMGLSRKDNLARIGCTFLDFGFNIWTDERTKIGLIEKIMSPDM